MFSINRRCLLCEQQFIENKFIFYLPLFIFLSEIHFLTDSIMARQQIEKFKVESLKFTTLEAHKLYLEDKNFVPINEGFHVFVNYYHRAHKDLFSNLKLGHTLIQSDIAIHIFVISVEYYSDNLQVIGSASSKSLAKNKAATKIINIINEIDAGIKLPEQIIGLPNYRGHCFVIAVLVPLFNNKDFVEEMTADAYSMRQEDWQKVSTFTALFKFYLCYKKSASKEDVFQIKNIPTNLHIGYESWSSYANKPRKPGWKADLELDRKMLKIVQNLSNNVDPEYKSPGGSNTKFFGDLFHLIIKEFNLNLAKAPNLEKLFYSDIHYEYYCQNCNISGLRGRVYKPFIEIVSKHKFFTSIQNYFENLEEFIVNKFCCENYCIGKTCNKPIIDIKSVKLVAAPKILVLKVISQDCDQWSDNPDNLELPQILKVYMDGNELVYEKFSFTVAYPCWKDEKGELVTIRHIKRKQNYRNAGYHVMSVMDTNDGWIEVNNASLLEPIQNYQRARGRMLIIYNLIE